MRLRLTAALAVVLLVAAAGCSQPPTTVAPTATVAPSPSPALGLVQQPIRVVAGPVCPVVTPNSSGCDDRPVPNAELVVRSAAGPEVARVRTDANGLATLSLPPGAYLLEPQPVEGLMGTAPSLEFTVLAGGPAPELVVTYDTGIR